MSDEKKKPDEETEGRDIKTEQAANTASPAPEETPEKTAENAAEGGETPEVNTTPDTQETPAESSAEENTEVSGALPELSAEDKLREENFRLRTQLEAMKIGFTPEVMEDAVVLAENIVKRDGSDISAALQAVAKKYPDWKADGKGKSKGGFKVGADSSSKTALNDEKVDKAFGLKKKN